jgi:hypothetical protein
LSELALDFAGEESPLEDELAAEALLAEPLVPLLSLLADDDASEEDLSESLFPALPLLA